MNYEVKKITPNIFLDNLFINFPLWFPISYIYLAVNYPEKSNFLFILVLFLFAETHFASTWLFLFDKQNWPWLKTNSYKLFFLPLYLIILIAFTWFFTPSLILILHYLASGWHVTKQSTGILKIYGANSKIYQFFVYFSSFTCLAIGLKNPGILKSTLDFNFINLILLVLFISYIAILTFSLLGKLNKKILIALPLLTGILIYIPILFFDNLATATAVGVGMHWCQYIAIMWSMNIRKNLNQKSNLLNLSFTLKRVLFVFLYALIMTSLAVIGMPNIIKNTTQYSYFYLIPLIFQLYHFYIDGFIWKFSDKHIKKSVLPFLFKNP